MLDAATSSEVEAILARHGLPTNDLSVSDGFANLVVLAPEHVVRLNSGRFPGAFRHEARVLAGLPPEIPKPVMVAFGHRSSGGEYLILERLPGENMEQAWPKLSTQEREHLVRQFAAMVKRLHEIPLAGWMHNLWVADVLAEGRWRDAYHAPPEMYSQLIASAGSNRPDLDRLLSEVSSFVAARMDAFGDAPATFIHTDLHFRNVIVHAGRIMGLIDFEGSRIGRRDADIDMLVRALTSANGASRLQYPGAAATFMNAYPELLSGPDLVARLEVYEAMWHLVQLHHWQVGDTWTVDPGMDLEQLVAGSYAQRIVQLLEPDNAQ